MISMLAVFKLKAFLGMLTSCIIHPRNATPAQCTITPKV